MTRGRQLLAGCGAVVAAVAVGVPVGMGHVGNATQNTKTPVVGDVKLGKVLFVAACGGCHTLAAAGTKGTRGGNLASEPSGYVALITRITYGGEGMPAFGNAFPKKQIQAIAAYVFKSTPYSGAGGGG
jgi:mono/diheme cytochrome c family protein